MTLFLTFTAFAADRSAAHEDEAKVSELDRLLADPNNEALNPPSAGSLYASDGLLASIARDFSASRAGDVVTIVVAEQASATSQGTTGTKRTSSGKASVTSLFGPRNPAGALTNLATLGGEQQLNGQGATSRQTTLSTTMSARVLKVLSNGNLIIEGVKIIAVNSEKQTISLRGIVRPIDLGPDNTVPSDRIANLEVQINGRGVVNDAIHRPNILYRVLLGILPF